MATHGDDPASRLVAAIRECRIVRLAYRRQRDEIITLHNVAPVDIRAGGTEWLKARTYLWAYCYDESRLERHLLDRVVSVTISEEVFKPRAILEKWPDGWLVPEEWTVPRGDDRDWE
jgi:predicted DNA-binding transcriptional regulator YafY